MQVCAQPAGGGGKVGGDGGCLGWVPSVVMVAQLHACDGFDDRQPSEGKPEPTDAEHVAATVSAAGHEPDPKLKPTDEPQGTQAHAATPRGPQSEQSFPSSQAPWYSEPSPPSSQSPSLVASPHSSRHTTPSVWPRSPQLFRARTHE